MMSARSFTYLYRPTSQRTSLRVILFLSFIIGLAGCAGGAKKSATLQSYENSAHPDLWVGLELDTDQKAWNITKLRFDDSTLKYPWIKVANPEASISKRKSECMKGLFVSEHQHCDTIESSSPFHETSLKPGNSVLRVITSPIMLGIPLLFWEYQQEFSEEKLQEALEEAYQKAGITKEKLAELRRNKDLRESLFQEHNLDELNKQAGQYGIRTPINPLYSLAHHKADWQSFESMSKSYAGIVEHIQQQLPEIEKAKTIIALGKKEEAEINAKKSYDEYVQAYNSLDSAFQYGEFIEKYENNDPNNYVPKVKEKLEEMQLAAANALRKAIEEKEEKQRKALVASISSFRKSIASGDESNCGLVVEVKPKIVLVETMDGTKWLKRDKLYPRHVAGCRLVNGVYQPPRDLPM